MVLRGRVVEEFYDDAGVCCESIEVSPCGPVCALDIPAGAWHTLRSLETGTVIQEVKDGPYEPMGGGYIELLVYPKMIHEIPRFKKLCEFSYKDADVGLV